MGRTQSLRAEARGQAGGQFSAVAVHSEQALGPLDSPFHSRVLPSACLCLQPRGPVPSPGQDLRAVSRAHPIQSPLCKWGCEAQKRKGFARTPWTHQGLDNVQPGFLPRRRTPATFSPPRSSARYEALAHICCPLPGPQPAFSFHRSLSGLPFVHIREPGKMRGARTAVCASRSF